MGQCMKAVQAFFSYHTLLLLTSCIVFSLIVLPLNTQLNCLVLGHPIAPFLTNFNPSALSIIVLFLFWCLLKLSFSFLNLVTNSGF
jgi:hypothetical protein